MMDTVQEILDVTRERLPGTDFLITNTDQCYFFKWFMSIIKCKVNRIYVS